jgi:hypothetical protein
MASVLANPAVAGLAVKALPVVADVAQGAGGALGGAIGGMFGKKGAKVGKKIGRGIVGIGRKILGFEGGGKVRMIPVRSAVMPPMTSSSPMVAPRVIGYSVGGKVQPKKRGGRRKK